MAKSRVYTQPHHTSRLFQCKSISSFYRSLLTKKVDKHKAANEKDLIRKLASRIASTNSFCMFVYMSLCLCLNENQPLVFNSYHATQSCIIAYLVQIAYRLASISACLIRTQRERATVFKASTHWLGVHRQSNDR